MYRLIIVDDEPLVQIGMKSMLDYGSLGMEVVGEAANGKDALELIEQYNPQIVITDIKMPVMGGLELMEHVSRNFESSPLFILLTNYEDFGYARRAMHCNVVDYLIKIELNEKVLKEALQKAADMLDRMSVSAAVTEENNGHTENVFINRFLNRLLNNFFSSEREIENQLRQFNLDFGGEAFFAAAAGINSSCFSELSHQKSYKLYMCIVSMAKVILERYANCHMAAYSQTTIGIILSLDERQDRQELCRRAFAHVNRLCFRYFNITLRFGVGGCVDSLSGIASSFSGAQTALKSIPALSAQPVRFYDDSLAKKPGDHAIGPASVNRIFIKALENYDPPLFMRTTEELAAYIRKEETDMENAIDIVSCLVHLIINNLDDGEKILNEAFSGSPKTYQILYGCAGKEEIAAYLVQLKECVARRLDEYRSCARNKILLSAKKHIKQHICEKLTLNGVAHAIGVSPNYLSYIFRKSGSCGFNDYITTLKMRRAKKLLSENKYKVYEVSEMLGFDNSYYFSKVYKKVIGFNPTETLFLDSDRSRNIFCETKGEDKNNGPDV